MERDFSTRTTSDNVGEVERDQQMDMVGHDRVIVDVNRRIAFWEGKDLLLYTLADRRQFHRGRGKPLPYGDPGQDAPPVMGADRDEIGAGTGIIVIRQAQGFFTM